MPEEAPLMLKQMIWDLKGSYFRKAQIMVMDLMATNNWKRPVYFAITIGGDGYYGLQKFFQLDGLAYRVVPIETSMSSGQIARVNTSVLYDKIMNTFKWGGIEKEGVYLDENNRRMLMNIKNNFARLANALVKESKIDSAITVLDKAVKIMPENKIPYSYYDLLIAEAYYQTKSPQKADKIMKTVATHTIEELNYFMSLPDKDQRLMSKDIRRSLMMAQEILRLTQQYERPELFEELNKKFESIIGKRI
jgi:tetratricopeptide (TPR) repeat protein